MRRVSREDVFKLVFEFTFLRERNESTLALLLADAELDDADREYIRSTYDGVTGDFDRLTQELDGLDFEGMDIDWRLPDVSPLDLAEEDGDGDRTDGVQVMHCPKCGFVFEVRA